MGDNLTVKREKVIEIVKKEGPLLPISISKKLEINTTFSGAILSELVNSKLINITTVKVGGSPFYYYPGDERKLESLIVHLNGKDQETVQLLKEKEILRDRDLSPLQRVSLRQVKDYAKQVRVTIDNQDDLFWKWFLLRDDKVKELIGNYLDKKENSKEIIELIEPARKETPIPIMQEEIRKQHEEKEAERIKKEKIKIKPEFKTDFRKEEQTSLIKEEEHYDPLGKFFLDNEIEILQQNIIKKNKEINYLVGLETRIGKSVFFLKYKDKKKINEADLSLAVHEAGKLPLIILSNGELNNKAKDMINREFRGVIFRKI